MRVHFLAAVFLILFGIYLGFGLIETAILCATISFVLVMEVVNTAIELTVDLIKSEFHPMARIIKDVAAGGVLIASINACAVGYMLFSKKLPFNIREHLITVKGSPWQVTFIILILVLGVTIMSKLLLHKGTPLRGGMPSGHAAIAFSIWMIIAFLTNNLIVITLSFLMAFLISRHRIKDAVHTLQEVIAGSVLGILITLLIFQIFR
jgi:diacylglycerol kinase (ATP)